MAAEILGAAAPAVSQQSGVLQARPCKVANMSASLGDAKDTLDDIKSFGVEGSRGQDILTHAFYLSEGSH